MLKRFFNQDTVLTGIVAGVGSEVLSAALLWAGLAIAGEPAVAHLRWFGICFLPIVFILQRYAKGREHLNVMKTLLTVLFITFVAFMILLFSTHSISMQ